MLARLTLGHRDDTCFIIFIFTKDEHKVEQDNFNTNIYMHLRNFCGKGNRTQKPKRPSPTLYCGAIFIFLFFFKLKTNVHKVYTNTRLF